MEKVFSGKPERTRPNSRLQPQNMLDATPVLFRLPMVHLQSFPVAGADFNSSRSTDPQATHGLMRSYAVGAQETAELTPPIVNSRVEEALTPTVEDNPRVSSEVAKTWWEHWSSGIVMVLLIVAMIVLGIIAVRSNSQPSSPLATNDLTSEFGDLESITVPTPEISETSSETLPMPTLSVESDQQTAETGDSLANELANTDVAPFESQLPTPSLAGQTTQTPTSTAVEVNLPEIDSTSEQLATATLLQPTPHDAPQQEYSQVSKLTNLEGFVDAAVPGAALGNREAQDALGTQQLSYPAQPASSQLGQSPALYDEAKGPSQPAVPAQQMLPGQQFVQEQPVHSMPNLAGNRTASNPVATQVSTAIPGLGGQPSSTAVRSTATPDSDEEEIIRAYLELTQAVQQPAESPSNNPNRYQRSAGN